MSDDTLLTLRQLADQLQLPESTVRYYRDAFVDRIPSVGQGRRRRYPVQAVDVLRSIAKSYAAGRSRAAIAASLDHQAPEVTAVGAGSAAPARAVDEVSNLDLLAAILDGEREQRDALWQMAKEIMRLTEVLEGQDKVLNEIADRAGVVVSGRLEPAKPAPALAAPAPGPEASRQAEPETPAPPEAPEPPSSILHPPSSPHDLDRLRAELETERALVERLRESKLQLEHRAADAEAELADQRRRSSVIKRIFGGDARH